MPDVYRRLYLHVADPECLALGDRLIDALRAELRGTDTDADANADTGTLDDARREAETWAAEESERYRSLLDIAQDPETRLVLARRAVLGCAPLGLRTGAWLQWLSCPADADDPLTLAVLALYASDVGVNRPRRSRGDAFLAVMRTLDLAEHAASTDRLAARGPVAEQAFRLPAILTALGRSPEVFGPEVIGADTCLRTVGVLPAMRVVRQALPGTADASAPDSLAALAALDLSIPRLDTSDPGALVLAEPLWTRLRQTEMPRTLEGFRWALRALQDWSSQLHDELAASCDPAFEMAELVRLRARDAAVYHHAFPLRGRPLSEWMTEACDDPAELVAALAGSRLIRRGHPDRSPLLGWLIDQDGPMFRIFSPSEQAVIRRWIASLDTASPAADTPRLKQHALPETTLLHNALNTAATPARSDTSDHRPADLRSAYQALQSRAHTPGLRAYAQDYVRDWLRESERTFSQAPIIPPERWDAQELKDWLAAQHEKRGQEFDAKADDSIPSRDELIDSTVQLAPLTLIDGSWLRGFTDYADASTEFGFSLFATYWDELGNGEPRLNHPLIYREVLAEMGVRLPPTGSAQFAAWDGFRDASFALPVYWLSIGALPRTFLPEILGLNLAMELSGVGGGYRRAALALKAYGLSTRFVDIHNTIDNIATGHTAWAADAIAAYLAGIGQLRGAEAQAAAWSRARVGFRSLSLADRPRHPGRARRRLTRRPKETTA